MSIVNISFSFIKISTGAAVVFCLFCWLVLGLGEMPTGFKNWGRWGLWIWGCTPLTIAMALVLLSKLGLLQRYLFGTVYKDFQSGRPLTTDLELVRARLGKWRTDSHPSLQRADAALEYWGGAAWTGEGLWRCVGVALVYPLLVLWLAWALTGSGTLGAAVVFPGNVPPFLRWASLAALMVFLPLMMLGVGFSQDRAGILERLNTWPQPARTLAARLNTIPPSASFLAGLGIFLLSGAVFVGVGVGVGVRFGAGAVAFLVAMTFAFAFAFTFTFAVAVAVAAAVAVAVAFAQALASASASTFPVVVTFIFALLTAGLIDSTRAAEQRWRAISAVLALVLFTSAIVQFLPQLPLFGIPLKATALQASSPPFIFLLFFAFAPLLNGLSDWLSINITRSLLQRYREQAHRGSVSGWQFHALDIGSALVLTVVLYAAILGALLFMQRAGWQVDVRDMMKALRDNPWTGSAQWLLLMALANLLPTLFHLALWLTAAAWSRDVNTHTNLSEVMAQMTRDRQAGARPAAGALLPGDGATQMFVYVLKIQRWLDPVVVFGLIVLSVVAFSALVPACADWALRWLP